MKHRLYSEAAKNAQNFYGCSNMLQCSGHGCSVTEKPAGCPTGGSAVNWTILNNPERNPDVSQEIYPMWLSLPNFERQHQHARPRGLSCPAPSVLSKSAYRNGTRA